MHHRARAPSPWQIRADADGKQSERRLDKDPFFAASIRLQSLLKGVGDGEEELLSSTLAESGPDEKLQVNVVLGGGITVAAFFICWLCGKDPWGGASLSLHSLQSAALGALFAVPLSAARVWSWSRDAYHRVPALEDMHRSQLEVTSPWLTGLGTPHLATLVALECLPLLFLLLPAAQGAITSTMALYNEMLQNSLHCSLPEQTSAVIAILLTATVAGVGKGFESGVSEEEYSLVNSAVNNADRYYRVMAMDSTSQVQDAERAALAFKAVAVAWMQSKEAASQLAGFISFVDVVFLGVVWHATGDLTSAAVASLLVNGVDYYYLHRLSRPKTTTGSQGS